MKAVTIPNKIAVDLCHDAVCNASFEGDEEGAEEVGDEGEGEVAGVEAVPELVPELEGEDEDDDDDAPPPPLLPLPLTTPATCGLPFTTFWYGPLPLSTKAASEPIFHPLALIAG